MCLDNLTNGLVIQTKCVNDSESQHWDYDEYNLQIKNGEECLAAKQFEVLTLTCRPSSLSQKWTLENYNRSMNPFGLH